MSAKQVVDKAVSDLKSAPSFTVSGSTTELGSTYTVNLGFKPGKGCMGTVTQAGKGSYTMVLTKPCDLNTMTSQIALPTDVVMGNVTTVNGQHAVPLTDKVLGGTLYVTDASTPQVLQLVNSFAGTSAKLNFNVGAAVTVSAPLADAGPYLAEVDEHRPDGEPLARGDGLG
jgi:hypothetical protein